MLSDKLIKSLAPQAKDYQVADGNGLYLRVRPTGTKTFFCEFRRSTGRVKRALGSWPELSLEAARSKLQTLTGEGDADLTTFGHIAELWLEAQAGTIQPQTLRLIKLKLNKYLLPAFRFVPINQIKPADLMRVLQGIKDKPTAARATASICNRIITWSVNAGFSPHNPCVNIAKALPRYQGAHLPSVSYRELPELAEAVKLARISVMQRLFIAWSLCSMLRPNENAGLLWSDVDKDVLTIPGARMKCKKPHRVPLSPFMLELLDRERALVDFVKPGSIYIWPGKNGHLCKNVVNRKLHEMGYKDRLCLHGFRALARSWLAEQDFDFYACERCLAHVEQSMTVQAYQRSDMLDKRREIVNAWSEVVAGYFAFVLDK